ncbi:unnamed protein product [Aspergillus oryzae var. brunneus]|uniref:Unnamed protein product n=2 Tax=Aspergillus oryzae TaxID=5062 RepID=A0AAN4YWH8_ASPOZ|nr:unnamed protein product [Aspergillus oryzae]GMG35477.1 unnamed protein product [Aspergillus oryzae]GMG44626.1 unnamed protein product [Aspergillus oryzae var. brunneus]
MIEAIVEPACKATADEVDGRATAGSKFDVLDEELDLNRVRLVPFTFDKIILRDSIYVGEIRIYANRPAICGSHGTVSGVQSPPDPPPEPALGE